MISLLRGHTGPIQYCGEWIDGFHYAVAHIARCKGTIRGLWHRTAPGSTQPFPEDYWEAFAACDRKLDDYRVAK